LTAGEVMQLPPNDELVLVSGIPPIRAHKARYYEDIRLKACVLPPPALATASANTSGDRPAPHADDWTTLPIPQPRAPPPTTPRRRLDTSAYPGAGCGGGHQVGRRFFGRR